MPARYELVAETYGVGPDDYSVPALARLGLGEDGVSEQVRVLIADKMDPKAAAIFRERGIEVDEKPGLSPEEFAAIIGDYDGLAVRSSTRVNAAAMDAAVPRLKVIGRAGIGVDTIDVPAATARGIVVMNTPFGNSITTAEHAIAMMFALAREIPAGRPVDPGRQVGEEPLHGRRAQPARRSA